MHRIQYIQKIPNFGRSIRRIRRIFGEEINHKNPLQPSLKQVKKLESMKGVVNYLQTIKPTDWCKIMEQHIGYLFIGKAELKIADQQLRADKLVSYVKANPQIKTIVTMDGHGRFILSLLQALGHMANDINIKVVDIDPIVNRWHQSFFPNRIESVEGNIFNYVPNQHTLVYMNFCGIGGQEGQENLAKYLSNIQSIPNYDLHLMISVSTARRAKGSCSWLTRAYTKSWLKQYDRTYKATKISDGPMNNFSTYCLKWPKL